jgi:choline dehydrogenase
MSVVDNEAVLNNKFQVRGVSNLRVVDNSVWPDIPGMSGFFRSNATNLTRGFEGFFVTTPIYMISEKAADEVLAFAKSKNWAPRFTA